MNQFRFPVLTDENIHPHVVGFLRDVGLDVLDIKAQNWFGMPDEDILAHAYKQERVVITHDSDFGRLAVLSGKPFIGILYLRPAEIQAERTIERLSKFFASGIRLTPPFIVVIQNEKIRVRYF